MTFSDVTQPDRHGPHGDEHSLTSSRSVFGSLQQHSPEPRGSGHRHEPSVRECGLGVDGRFTIPDHPIPARRVGLTRVRGERSMVIRRPHAGRRRGGVLVETGVIMAWC